MAHKAVAALAAQVRANDPRQHIGDGGVVNQLEKRLARLVEPSRAVPGAVGIVAVGCLFHGARSFLNLCDSQVAVRFAQHVSYY